MPQMSRTTRHKAWNAICSEIHATRTVTPWHPRRFCVPRSAQTSQHLKHSALQALWLP
jgi:hypothetical protein